MRNCINTFFRCLMFCYRFFMKLCIFSIFLNVRTLKNVMGTQATFKKAIWKILISPPEPSHLLYLLYFCSSGTPSACRIVLVLQHHLVPIIAILLTLFLGFRVQIDSHPQKLASIHFTTGSSHISGITQRVYKGPLTTIRLWPKVEQIYATKTVFGPLRHQRN